MKDTARPKPLRHTSSIRAAHQSSFSSSNPPSSPIVTTSERYRRGSTINHNDAIYTSTDDDSSSQSLPWGTLPARSGRGNIHRQCREQYSDREIYLAVALMGSAWISGQFGLEWRLWPEADEFALGECVWNCWRLVQEQQERDAYESHKLEEVLARKVYTFISIYISIVLIFKRCETISVKSGRNICRISDV